MSRPNWIVENVIAELQNIVATLEMIASTNALDLSISAKVRAAIATGPAPSLSVSAPVANVVGLSAGLVALYNIIPVLVSGVTGVDPSVVPALFALARGLGQAMTPTDAVTAFAYAVDAISDVSVPLTGSQNRLDDATNQQIVARVSRMVLLAPYAEALVTVSFATRPDGITARADCVTRYEREIYLSTGPNGGDMSVRLANVRNGIVEYLSRTIVSLADVVTVSANASMPSLWWAWRLYQDPTRAPELVERNDVSHPSYMPLSFTAIQSAL